MTYFFRMVDPIDKYFMARNVKAYAKAIHENSRGLDKIVEFIDETVLGIARHEGNWRKISVYTGHEFKHALQFQAVNTPNILIQHLTGPIGDRRPDQALYIKSCF